MRQALFASFAIILSGCASLANEPSTTAGGREMKMAFDVTDAAPLPLSKKLEVIELTRKQLVEQGYKPMIVVSFRGNASFFTQDSVAAVKEADRAEALKVKAQLRSLATAPGVVAIEQCNVPLAERKLDPKRLMHEVKLVPNGWIALAEYQNRGYAYIAP
jgi:intracellular sulfur oxidation DsrE/DsrF family protein